MMFDREVYFDAVRASLFNGALVQSQVKGQEAILDGWEANPLSNDLRHLAYALATTLHETASTMQPIEEYGRGKGKEYGTVDPETKQIYYGRGFVQLTWRTNYAIATKKLMLTGENDLEWYAHMALDMDIATDVMFQGMWEGWFRVSNDGKPQTLLRHFNDTTDDPYTAREIINGDKHIIPLWADGVSIGQIIADYHRRFLNALQQAYVADEQVVTITVQAPKGVKVLIKRI
jgi:hypothetical protein